MPIRKVDIEEFLGLSLSYTIFDVRAPIEYSKGHIPGALNLAIFDDAQRSRIGTAYKKEGRRRAVDIGISYFSGRMNGILMEMESLMGRRVDTVDTILLHCWRGGMRSEAVAWVLSLYGINVVLLEGGYKSFRRWVINRYSLDYDITILGGYTGSGKTQILNSCKNRTEIKIIDLEGIASHKGSAFGGIGQEQQPSQEMFENLLSFDFWRNERDLGDRNGKPKYILEDESQRIGKVLIPNAFWYTMRMKKVIFIDIPFESRLEYIVAHYGQFDRSELIASISRLHKRLGGLETKQCIGLMLENDLKGAFRILLNYYDKYYEKSLFKRDNPDESVIRIRFQEFNQDKIVQTLLVKINEMT